MLTKTEWCKENYYIIKDEIIADAASWLSSFEQGFDGYLDLDGNAHRLKGADKNKGKVAYQGAVQTAKSGAPYVTLTLIFQRAIVPVT